MYIALHTENDDYLHIIVGASNFVPLGLASSLFSLLSHDSINIVTTTTSLLADLINCDSPMASLAGEEEWGLMSVLRTMEIGLPVVRK
jgi:beta-catenin-like protein 1